MYLQRVLVKILNYEFFGYRTLCLCEELSWLLKEVWYATSRAAKPQT